MHVTLRQLQVFESAARHLSFSRAAAELHLSQPGVSMQIKQLEATVGQALFEQLGKKIFLTGVGREVLRAGQAIAQQLVDLEDTLNDLRGLKQGALTVGVVSTVSYFAIGLISRFRQEHPEVRITLNVVNREALLAQLANNEVDLALMGQAPEGHDLESTPFMENPLVVIAPFDHPLAKRKNIALARVAEADFVAREPGSGTRGATEAFFQAHGMALRVAMEMNKNEAIKQAVMAELGLGIVSLHTIDMELALKRLTVLNVEDFPIMRHWHIVHRNGKRFAAIPEAFRQFVLEQATELIKPPAY
ncbi:MAG TPA: LysR family transcriptional regulator [Zetaproteobacteria bacterium]|nr:LysR family transcriptional regulator [Zetaproteobacteria bacterium]